MPFHDWYIGCGSIWKSFSGSSEFKLVSFKEERQGEVEEIRQQLKEVKHLEIESNDLLFCMPNTKGDTLTLMCAPMDIDCLLQGSVVKILVFVGFFCVKICQVCL